MKLNIKLLKKISEIAGTSGFEKRIRDLIKSEIIDLVDSVEIDNIGNLIAFKKGTSDKKLMVSAHMDEIGFIVNHIDDKGFIRFYTLGGFDPKTLTSQRVIVHGKKDLVGVMGSKPIHLMTTEERNKVPKIEDYFIDLGLEKQEVEKIVSIGNPITRSQELIEIGNCINGKSLDNRISVFVLIEALKILKEIEIPYNLFAVFSVQEEVGTRGAIPATLQIEPDFSIAVDTTIAYDVPGSRANEQVTKLGDGAAIKIMDSSVICDQRMIEFMKKIANEIKIKWQLEILPLGGTDTGNMQRMVKNASIAGAISIPTRHIHQTVESVNKKDVEDAINLLINCVLKIDNYNWNY